MSYRPLRALAAIVWKVALPHLLGGTRGDRLPDAELVHVERLVAEEVHRAHEVVEVPALQQLRDLLLASGDEVDLEAQEQVCLLAHRRAVGVEVVVGEALPQRMAPDLQRLGEAVDVLGDAQLVDAALVGRLAVERRMAAQ